MKNVDKACICSTKDSQIKFEENKRKIIFLNPSNHRYKKVKVDGCAIKTGQKCDDLLISQDEHEEHFVELKGVDIMHAIDQLEQTILKIGEFDDKQTFIYNMYECSTSIHHNHTEETKIF